jgi:hypothetical protein
MQEIWKDVVGFEGLYKVSNLGNVIGAGKSWVWGMYNNITTRPESESKKSIDTCGYYQVWLSKNGRGKHYLVHRLIAKAFLDNPENKKDVNHKNGNKLDNVLDNLEWATRSENIIHAFKNNLKKPSSGSKHGMSRLKEDDVLKIRELVGKHTKLELAEMFGVGRRNINNIVNYKSWTHI